MIGENISSWLEKNPTSHVKDFYVEQEQYQEESSKNCILCHGIHGTTMDPFSNKLSYESFVSDTVLRA